MAKPAPSFSRRGSRPLVAGILGGTGSGRPTIPGRREQIVGERCVLVTHVEACLFKIRPHMHAPITGDELGDHHYPESFDLARMMAHLDGHCRGRAAQVIIAEALMTLHCALLHERLDPAT